MNTNPVRAEPSPIMSVFLGRQGAPLAELQASSDRVRIRPGPGVAPDRYLIEFAARGLSPGRGGQAVEVTGARFGIFFPPDYLLRVSCYEVLSYLGPHRPWHPNLHPDLGLVCLSNLRPGTSALQLVHLLYSLWTWQLLNTSDDGLNREASQWARHQPPSRFPVDPRPLRRPAAAPAAEGAP